MIRIKVDDVVTSICRSRSGNSPMNRRSIIINNFDSIDTNDDFSITIFINESLSYIVNVNIPSEKYIDSLLRGHLRNEKIEVLLTERGHPGGL